jgi:opacity protein-like surface antigen
MKRFLGGIALVGLAMSLAGAAQAQTASFPVWYSPAFGAGVGIFGDWGTGLNDDAKFAESAPMSFGGHILFSAAQFKISAGAWYMDTKNDLLKKPINFGGNLGVTIYKGATSPIYVDLMVGAGYTNLQEDDTVGTGTFKTWDFPVGLPIAYGATLSGGHTVEPWIAPVLHIFSDKTEGGFLAEADTSKTNLGFGVTGGINFYSAMGIGVFVVADWMSVKRLDATESSSPFRLGAGLAWRFSVPSLPESKGFVGG